MIDLDDLDFRAAANKGSAMELTHPTTGAALRQDDGTPVTITLAGQDSDVFIALEHKLTDRRYEQMQRVKRVALSAAGVEADRINRVVTCTLGWNGVAWGGQQQEFSPEKARELFTRWPWALDQAERFIEDRGNFARTA